MQCKLTITAELHFGQWNGNTSQIYNLALIVNTVDENDDPKRELHYGSM
jgi:hypothetical protein